MRTEQEIRHKIDITCGMGIPANVHIQGFIEALEWVLEGSTAFACPECGSGIIKIEPCSGYYSYSIHKYTGEVLYGTNDFNSESTDDPWYECERCKWKADGRWTDWYEKERSRDEEDSDGQD